ncbi:unnamed protein product [Rotaria socialis]|uniref:IQ calmodulin-binding motif family protein n=1 Tax=Rotaria socialis TaxID=392032 RepID=A0A819X425_9BILA|nr:unnamed protein product [Rotaria socialis]CAF4136364.1 unnamed protein product [Rotaria socialis]
MTSTGQYPEPWKSTAATLFNPYLNINQMSNRSRQQSVRTRVLTPTRHSRAPPESLVETGNLRVTTSESKKRPRSKRFPSQNAAEEVSIYVQQMIHNQFCGRSGTPSDLRYDDQKVRRRMSSPDSRITMQKRISSSKHQSRVSQYTLDDFFNTTDEQMSRMASMMPGRESSFSENYSLWGESPQHKSNGGERLTLADMCHIASNVGDKMSQSKEKVGLEAIRGFRLPSARLTYEPYEYHAMDTPLVFGQHNATDRIRLSDILTDDNFSNAPMIEIVTNDVVDDKASRASRTHLKSSTTTVTTKINEFKDWRGKISQANLPDVRNRSRRQHSASIVSPQRPCTAASNFSKSRPESSGLLINDSQKADIEIPSSLSEKMIVVPVASVLKNPSNNKQRQRNYPLNVRIDEANVKQTIDLSETGRAQSYESVDNLIDPPCLSLPSENNDDLLKTSEMMPNSTPVPMMSTSTTPFTMYTQELHARDDLSPDPMLNKRNYKLIQSSSRQIYRTIPEPNRNSHSNQTNEQLTQLTLSQLELLENYDPMVSAKIGIPFIPVQMLARPREAYQSAKLSIDQIQRRYPKKNGQPIFEPRVPRSCHSLIDISQTLQLTKSKRIRVERQTTFEKPENESSIEESIQIKSLENPNRLTISLYSPSEQHLFVKHTNSIRTSSKAYRSQLDDISTFGNSVDQQANLSIQSKDEQQMEYNLNVLNIRTQQEVNQRHHKGKPSQKRLVFPTSIITSSNVHSTHNRIMKQQGRPIPSVFLTQDPDEYNYSTSIYHQARQDTDIQRAFKGFVVENIQKKLSPDERMKREEQQKAAITIQRAYREHLERRIKIEKRRPSASKRREEERHHRRILSAKRAQHIEQKLIEQTRIRDENKEYKKMIEDTGPSLRIFANFNEIDVKFSAATLNRAAICIQRWWRGFLVRHTWHCLKEEVAHFGLTWFEFSSRYRQVIKRIQKMRQSENQQFLFNINQAKDFLTTEKKLTTIYKKLSFNDKLDRNELEKFFECCDLSATSYEIDEALESVLQHYSQNKNDSFTKEIIFDVIYYIYPPKATGLETSRKSTWIRPIIDDEDETAIQGTRFLEPIDMNIVYKFLEKQ